MEDSVQLRAAEAKINYLIEYQVASLIFQVIQPKIEHLYNDFKMTANQQLNIKILACILI